MHEWAGSEHFVEVEHFFGDVEPFCLVVEFLCHEFFAEDGFQFGMCEWFAGLWVEQWFRLLFHVGTHVVPLGGHLFFAQINLVWYVFFHLFFVRIMSGISKNPWQRYKE